MVSQKVLNENIEKTHALASRSSTNPKRSPQSQRAVRTDLIVFSSPLRGQDSRLQECVENLDVQEFITQSAIERLDVAVGLHSQLHPMPTVRATDISGLRIRFTRCMGVHACDVSSQLGRGSGVLP